MTTTTYRLVCRDDRVAGYLRLVARDDLHPGGQGHAVPDWRPEASLGGAHERRHRVTGLPGSPRPRTQPGPGPLSWGPGLARIWHECRVPVRSRRSERAPGRIRTCGLLLRRQTLYPLSYGGAPANIGVPFRAGASLSHRPNPIQTGARAPLPALITPCPRFSACRRPVARCRVHKMTSVHRQRCRATLGQHLGHQLRLVGLGVDHGLGELAHRRGLGMISAVLHHGKPALVVAQHQL